MSTLVGKPAPQFTTEGVTNAQGFKTYSLSECKGKWVVLFFYPQDFTFICPTEILQFSKRMDEFAALNTVVLGISTDSKHAHKAWLKDLGDLTYPLLEDVTHEISRSYDALLEAKGISLRSTIIIDEDGVVQYALYHSNNVGRSVEEVLRALKALRTGELCPVEWKPGEKTLGKA